jgi:D-sedoheptulose 7-phosphate isomerase
MRGEIAAIFGRSIAAKRQFLREYAGTLESVVKLIADAIRRGNKILLFGNGGSAADAQHMAAEFVGRFAMNRPPLAAIALTTDTSALTSIANDFGYSQVFAKQIQALGNCGDVAIAASTSGNSPSVVRAVRVCRQRGIHTVGLTGGSGGRLGGLVDYHLCVSATAETARIQETHILVAHTICDLVDRLLFAAPSLSDRRRNTEAPRSSRRRRQRGAA